jgi:hypothetical protein
MGTHLNRFRFLLIRIFSPEKKLLSQWFFGRWWPPLLGKSSKESGANTLF